MCRAPRPAGSAAESAARAYCTRELERAGFVVREQPFEYSALVGRYGMPIAGLTWVLVLVAAARLGATRHPLGALSVALAYALALRSIAPRALRDGVARWGAMRRASTNLIATRGDEPPRVWLVAHLDSKSQPVPMIARVVGVASCALAWLATIALAAAQLAGRPVLGLWEPLVIMSAVLALPVVGSTIGTRSPGALDNASGVATVLLAARDARQARLGVLITSAEELGLAGARQWVRNDELALASSRGSRVAPIALNVDSVDDDGALRVMRASPLPGALERALDDEPGVRRGGLPPGVLVDAIALADGGFAALTISRATFGSLARIHAARDARDTLTGSGIVLAAALLGRLARAAERDVDCNAERDTRIGGAPRA